MITTLQTIALLLPPFLLPHSATLALSTVTQPLTSVVPFPLAYFDYETQDRLPFLESGYQTWYWTPKDNYNNDKPDEKSFSINYIELGDPSKPTIILIHGFGASAYHFRFNLPILARQYHVIALDMLGFGQSDKPLIKYVPDVWRDQVVDFLSYKLPPSKPVVLCGNSLGGYTALSASVSDRINGDIRGCILLNSAGSFSDSLGLRSKEKRMKSPLFLQNLQTWLQRVIIQSSFHFTKKPTRIEQVLRSVYPVNNANVDSELVNSIQLPSLHPNAAEVFYRVLSEASTTPYIIDELVKQLQCQLLVCWGKSDPWFRPTIAEKLIAFVEESTNVPKAERVLVDAGHCPHDENPQQVNEIILNFMNQVV